MSRDAVERSTLAETVARPLTCLMLEGQLLAFAEALAVVIVAVFPSVAFAVYMIVVADLAVFDAFKESNHG